MLTKQMIKNLPAGIHPITIEENCNPYTLHVGPVAVTFEQATTYPGGSIPIDIKWLPDNSGILISFSVFTFFTLKFWIH